MPLSSDRQSQIAFKNLLGKSQVQKNFGVGNEFYGYLFNVPSTNVWSSKIPTNDPALAVQNQVAVQIVADLVGIQDSAASGQFLSYQTVWGSTPSVQGDLKDPKTNQPFKYGEGTLKDITAGNNIVDLVPDSYGLNSILIQQTHHAFWVVHQCQNYELHFHMCENHIHHLS